MSPAQDLPTELRVKSHKPWRFLLQFSFIILLKQCQSLAMLAPCNFKDSGNLSKQGKPQPVGKNMLLLAWTSSLVFSAEGAWLIFNYLNLISFHWTCFTIMNLKFNLTV